MKTEIGTDVLAEHGRFVRHLAQALVREPSLADDVAQETWLRWFTRPPRDASRPRAWLARVTQGVALNLRRSEGRRADVEQGTTPSEPADASPDDSLRQAELIERVAAAVRALEAPYREVILARFFRGLSVRELAQESGASEEALRSRERRALEQLRAKLDRDFGARSTWALALARFVERPTLLTPPQGTSSVSSPVWLAAGLCMVAGALSFVAWRTLGAPPTTQVGTSQAALGSVTGTPESSKAHTPAPARREPAVTTNASDTSARSKRDDGQGNSTSALTSLPLSELRARFLLENGSPAAGARWSLDGELANDELAELYGLPEDWSDPAGVLEADGSLLLQFDPPRAYQFYLHVKASGHALASFRFSPEPEELLDFGTVSLERGATILGHLLDASGAPIVGERWYVRADALEALADEQRAVLPTFADVDATTGTFLLEDVPPGRVTLEASNELDGETSVKLTLTGGEVRTCDVTYDGPHDATRLLVSARSWTDSSHAPALEHVRLRGDDGREHAPSSRQGMYGFVFDGLPDGLYLLEIDDPWFAPWSQAGVPRGGSVTARLEPCSRVLLSARDPHGSVLPSAELSVALVRAGGSPAERPLMREGELFAGRAALFPGDHVLRVRCGTLVGDLAVTALGFDETRSMELALVESAHLAGRLLRPDGTPLAYHDVLLLEPAAVDDSETSPILAPGASANPAERWRKQLGLAVTGEDGSFRLPLRAGGVVLLHASHRGGTSVSSERFTLAAGESRSGLELVLADGASVAGRVLAPEGLSLAGMRLWLVPAELEGRFSPFLHTPLRLDAEGRFARAGLRAGVLEAFVALPAMQRPESGGEGNGMRSFHPLHIGSFEAGVTPAPELSAAELVASVTLDVLVNGSPLAKGEVTMQRTGPNAMLVGRSAPNGHWGPMLATAGEWTLTVRQPGSWQWRAPGSLWLAAGEQRQQTLQIEVAPGTLRFVDADGAALAHRAIYVALDGEPFAFLVAETDEDGRLALTLATLPHRFALDRYGPGQLVEWTAAGPTVSDLQL